MDNDFAPINSRLQHLLDRADTVAPVPRPEFEETLTDGYARALELEAECRRIEARIAEIATAFAAAGTTAADMADLRALAHRLSFQRAELAELRDLLVQVRAHGYAKAV